MNAYSIIVFAAKYIQEFQQAQQLVKKSRFEVMQKWRAPDAGFIMINVDCAINQTDAIRGIGMVARNIDGMVVGAVQSNVNGIKDPTLIETLVAVRALYFAKDRGFTKLVLEGDALGVINKVNDNTFDLSMIGNFVSEVKLIRRHFLVCSVNHVFRKANKVAHILARDALSFD